MIPQISAGIKPLIYTQIIRVDIISWVRNDYLSALDYSFAQTWRLNQLWPKYVTVVIVTGSRRLTSLNHVKANGLFLLGTLNASINLGSCCTYHKKSCYLMEYASSTFTKEHLWMTVLTHFGLALFSCSPMMTSSNWSIFRVTGPLCEEFTGHRWISLTKAIDAELCCFLKSVLE